jgi:hypothetical protein
LREIGAVRDLAQTLDRGRESCQRELAALTVDSDRQQKLLVKIEAERDGVLDQLRVEVIKVVSIRI